MCCMCCVLCIGLYKTFSESSLILLSKDNQLFISIYGSYYSLYAYLLASTTLMCTVYIYIVKSYDMRGVKTLTKSFRGPQLKISRPITAAQVQPHGHVVESA